MSGLDESLTIWPSVKVANMNESVIVDIFSTKGSFTSSSSEETPLSSSLKNKSVPELGGGDGNGLEIAVLSPSSADVRSQITSSNYSELISQ